MERSGWILVVGVAGVLSGAAPAAAQDVAAPRALFDKGLAEMQAGRYESGCPRLGESYRLDPRPGTLFTLAECEARRGRLATAVARYSEYLSLYERMPPEQRGKQLDRDRVAARQKAALAPRVPELTLALPASAPGGTIVKRDEQILAAPSLGVGLPVDPGEHVVTTQAPGAPETSLRFTLAPGEHRVIDLEVKAAPAAAGGEAPRPAGSSRRVAAYAVGGLGIAGLGAGIVTGALMLAKKGTVDAGCRDGAVPGVKLCTPDAAAAGNSAKTLGAVSSISLLVGLASMGAAVVLFVTEPKPEAGDAPSQARWLGAGVLAAGPDGAVVGARGVW